MVVENTYGRIDGYLECLKTEIRNTAAKVSPGAIVNHIHFGGGSPSFLNGSDFLSVIGTIFQEFPVAPTAEIAVEVDPRTMDAEKAKTYAAAGVNRVSLGVQDFDEDVQVHINRIQPFDMVKKCIEDFRSAGISKINLDLIFGLPKQTRQTIEKTVSLALGLSPDRISLFGYAHVPWFKKHQQMLKAEHLPDKALRSELEKTARAALVLGGMRQIGLDHYAVPGDPILVALQQKKLKRNFQGYTDDSSDYLIGFGVSSISRLPGGFAQNSPQAKHYEKLMTEQENAVIKGIALTKEDNLRSAVIMELMCNYYVDVAEKCAEFNVMESHLDESFYKLLPLTRDGLCVVQNRTVTVPDEARALVRIVASVFDEYLVVAEQKHSTAL